MGQEFLKERMLESALVVATLFRLWKAYPLTDMVPVAASDFSSHVFKVWYVASHGVTGWNHLWYGGYPFLKFYPPLAYTTAALFEPLVGVKGAFYLVSDFAWIVAPFLFYLILKDYRIDGWRGVLALSIFSFVPVAAVFFKNGNMPFTFSLIFVLLFWRHMRRYFDGEEDVLRPTVFFILTGLTHVFSAFFLFIVSLGWSLSRERIRKLFQVSFLSGIFLSPFYLPFVTSASFGGTGGVSVVSEPVSQTSSSIATRFATMGIPVEFLALTAVLFGITLIPGLVDRWEDERYVISSLVVAGLAFLLLNYKRVAFIAVIPGALLSSMATERMKRLGILTVVVALAMFSFFTLQFTQPGNIPTVEEDRAAFYPAGSVICDRCLLHQVYLSPMNGNENIFGWFIQGQKSREIVNSKPSYNHKLENLLSREPEEAAKLLRAGMVNSVGVEKGRDKYMEFMQSVPGFTKVDERKGFVIFSPEERFTYLELNGERVEADVEKSERDRVEATFTCSPGTLTIKETFDRDWRAFIDGERVNLKPNEHGFMETEIESSGECNLKMTYRRSLV